MGSGSVRVVTRRFAVVLLACAWLRPLAAEADVLHPPPDFTIAFIGDQSLSLNAQAVLQMIEDEGADAVVHSGDFDYLDDPRAWEAQIDAILGPDFPYFASIGNHDWIQWFVPGGYLEGIEARMNRIGIPWTGALGTQSALRYRGIDFFLTSPGIGGPGDGVHDVYLAAELLPGDSAWRISSWHKNQQLMQVGSKRDETGWGVYEESRRGGAIIATAHEHSYSRTHLLRSFQNQTVASTENTLVLARDDPTTPEDEGKSFAFVSGLGGASVRAQVLDGPWWASIYTSTQGATAGALFGVFHTQGDPRLAHFYFKAIDGTIPDDFFVRTTLVPEDADLDGVDDDGDASGTIGDRPCLPGQDVGCDDSCPANSNPDQADAGGPAGPGPNGVGDVCQCADASEDGLVDAADLTAIQLCLTGQAACSPRCDADGNGLCEAADVIATEEALQGLLTPACILS